MNNDNKKKKSNKKYVVIAILLLIIGISIGYTALSATLNISGTTTIEKASWDIHFENLTIKDGSVNAIKNAVIDGKKTSIDYSIELTKPGDFYEFSVDIKNAGTIPAKVAALPILSGLEESQKNYINYEIKYSDNTEIKKDDYLDTEATKTIKVRVEYKNDLAATELPTESQEINLTFAMNYIQG